VRLLRRWVLKVPYISLVNLIAGRAVVRELVAGDTQPHRIAAALSPLLTDEGARERMQKGYKEVEGLLGRHVPPEEAAALIVGARHTGSVPTAHNS
jgi:lipid-A-disaccharide synthase